MFWLIERFQAVPGSIAFIHEGREVNYGTVVQTILSFRNRIELAGIQCGETVVVMGDYSPETFCMMMALALNGNIVVPLTRGSVIDESLVLEISGCDWYVEFDTKCAEAAISHRCYTNENELLDSFRKRSSPGLVLFSSGSTGKPKGILHDFNQVAEKFRKQREALVAIPFLMVDHFGGINTLLAITASLGTIVTVSDRSVTSICGAIERYKIELLPTTPSFLTLLMASGLYKEFDLSSLNLITYGTEVMPQSTLDRVCHAFPGVSLQQTYGLSEVGVLRSQSRGDGSIWVRVGGEGYQTKIINGILWIKSEYAMVGYLNSPSEFDADGWFNTQDQVDVDGDYFRILGRVTDLINVGGQKVYPAEVENVILGIDNILDVAVFGEQNNLLGQIVVAKVVLDRPEAVGDLKKRVRQACLTQLASFKVPAKVILAEGVLHSARQKKIRHA